MPGLSQLKKFNDDILSLGNEAELREQRGEKVVTIPIPNNIEDFDDSNDFIMGISDLLVEPHTENSAATDENASADGRTAAENQSVSIPDLSSLIGNNTSDASSAGIPDLSMFMDEPAQAENPTPAPKSKPTDFVDLSLEELLGGTGFDGSTGTTVTDSGLTDAGSMNDSASDMSLEQNELPSFDEEPTELSSSAEQAIGELPELDEDMGLSDSSASTPETSVGEIGNLPTDDFTLEDISGKSSQDDDFEIPDSSAESPTSNTDDISDLNLSDSSEFSTAKNDAPQMDNFDDFNLEPIDESAGYEPSSIADTLDLPPLEDTPSANNDKSSIDDLNLNESDDSGAGNLDLDSSGDTAASDDASLDDGTFDAALPDDASTDNSGFGNLNFDESDDFGAGSLDLDSNSDTAASDDASPSVSSLDTTLPDDAGADDGVFGDLDFDESDDFGAGSLDFDSSSDAAASDDATLQGDNALDTVLPDDVGTDENSFGNLNFDESDDFGAGSLDLDSSGDTAASDDASPTGSSLDAALPDDAGADASGLGNLNFDESDDFGAGNLDLGSSGDTAASDGALQGDDALDTALPDDTSTDENGFGDLNFDESDDFGAGNLDLGSSSDTAASDDALQGDDALDTALPDDAGADDGDFSNLSFDESDDFGAGGLDLGSSSDTAASDDALGGESNGLGEGISENFDTSEMDGMDFSETGTQSDSEFELDNDINVKTDAGDFEIQGFTDVDTVAEGKNGKMKIPGAEAAPSSEESDLPPNTLSDADYTKFIDNLSGYPLNVRLAVEELIIKNEFTDEAEFEIVRKVLKKVSARQLASELEKMLDIAIPVPRDFERRTVAEYEVYKASFQYQLRNKIIPGALMSIIGVALAWLLFMFSRFYIFEPAMAAHLYKQGYNLLIADDYPQSEEKFSDAVKYHLQKKWFFKYARAYRDRKQYIRAEQMYKAILRAFKYNKEAGLEYARMELDELTNYEKAEEIALRDVLDHHINDPDGILLLGDIYLDWATEKDPSKFDFARERYSDLVQTNKAKKKHFLYLSRMLRYFIRTDNLLEVLRLKDQFMPKEKSLEAADWTELSGYLLDKLYGPLPPSDEYLRSKIEDAKKMLVRAVKADPSNPVALYNMSRYYIHMHDGRNAKDSLMQTIRLFDDAPALKKRDVYKNIDSYRLLGEQYTDEREYIKALEAYTAGISLYSAQHEGSGLEGTSQIGKLYSDIGDIDFFISGDLDSALLNYKDSVDNFNDTAQIRYKIGYIQYGKKSYAEALGSFMKASEDAPSDASLLLAMGNTLSMRDDNYAAEGYYERLLEYLDAEKAQKGILFPQVRSDEEEVVDFYLKASNNLGVTLYRLARRTGNSDMNARAMVQFQQSLRAWDALTRNQVTMLRLGGSNLAEQNMKYVSHSMPDYEPAIYTDLPRTLSEEEEEFGR